MPVHLKLPLPGGTILALWRIDEEETPLASLCTVAEQQEAAAFAAPAAGSNTWPGMRCCTRCCPKHTQRTIREEGPY
ncbi:MAG: hypothetical protein ACLR1G_15730 [Alistipes indistinctus]